MGARAYSLTILLSLSSCALVLLVGAAFFALNWYSARVNLEKSLGLLATTRMAQMERDIRYAVTGIEHQAAYAARGYLDGSLVIDTQEELDAYGFGMTSATSYLQRLSIVAFGGRVFEISQDEDATAHKTEAAAVRTRSFYTWESREYSQALKILQQGETPFWQGPDLSLPPERRFIRYYYPINSGAKPGHLLIFWLSIGRMSALMQDLSTPDMLVFLLDKNNQLMAAGLPEHSKASGGEDPLLLHLHEVLQKGERDAHYSQMLDAPYSADVVNYNDRDFILILGGVQSYVKDLHVKVAWTVPLDQLSEGRESLIRTGLTALALLLLALVAAAVVAIRLSAPVRRAALAVTRVGELDIREVRPLDRSSIQEMNQLTHAFNRMLGGLKAFSRYVPVALVTRLLRENRVAAASEERVLAVMFTDIVGFTSLSEQMNAQETALFINEHLELIGAEVSKRNGTIDKFIGDALMAFWGAPEAMQRPAVPAADAALAIRAKIKADNTARLTQGLKPVRVRIGLHVGPLVVGDIGTSERINYTVIGDTVNTAARLESMGKELLGDAEVCILISGELRDMIGARYQCTRLGHFPLKGKSGETLIYSLDSKRSKSKS